MAKKLVIVESPAKAKTINRILGADYVVKSSMGHVRDLPVRSLGVDIEHAFAPAYVLVKGRKKVIGELRGAAESCDSIYLAPDPDREGESIAWHLQSVLAEGNEGKKFLRVQYNEITPGAVRQAFENPGEIDMNRVDAQQARRILDRIVGYKVSPLLWRRIKRGLSAGRVQSVALRLVCEREAAIESFVPEEYWILGAVVRKLVVPLEPFRIKLAKINGEKAEISSSEQAGAAQGDLDGRQLRVLAVNTRTVSRRAAPPFITSTLQQAASTRHGFSPARTMRVAQTLYEGVNMGQGPVGLITYMRTDSVTVSRDAMGTCRDFVNKNFGAEYCPEKPNVYRSRSTAQEAHEAIRPTEVTLTPDSLRKHLDAAGLKIYTLIWRRFVASQMSPAKIEQRTAEIEAVSPDEQSATTYLFRATASEIVFPGHMKVSGIPEEKNKEDGEEIDRLPALSEGEPLTCLEWLADRKETKPPPRYNEASLVRELEKNGIGRPSTYAQIIGTLQERTYVTKSERRLTPSDLGKQVNEFLVANLGDLFDVGFTAKMEESLDEIEKGAADWRRMLGDFYERFNSWVTKAAGPPADPHAVSSLLACLEKVQEWAPAVKRGKRTYSDEKFVTSVRKQAEEAERPISDRQLQTLARMGWRYREQVPDMEGEVVRAVGRDAVEISAEETPRESTSRKLEILRGLDLEDSARDFVGSLGDRVEQGRRLTEAQLKALDRIVCSYAARIPDFETIKQELELTESEIEEDTESAPLLAAFSNVTEWNEPTKRGKRVFDDAKFYNSLSSQFERKGFLSGRQRAALKRMVTRYRNQVPNYDELSEQFELGKKGGRRPRGGSRSSGGQ